MGQTPCCKKGEVDSALSVESVQHCNALHIDATVATTARSALEDLADARLKPQIILESHGSYGSWLLSTGTFIYNDVLPKT